MDDLEKSTELLKDALDELRKSSTLSSKTLDKLATALKENTKDLDDNTEAVDEETKARKELTRSLKDFARGLADAAGATRENREDFRSLKPAVEGAGALMKSSIASISKGITAAGELLSGLGAFIPRIGTIVSAVGTSISKAGQAVDKFGKEAVDAGVAYMKFALDETQRVVQAFRDLGEVGGITANSMRGVYSSAQALGLSVDTYAKLIAKNAEGLASAGVTVTGGAEVLERITTAGTEFEDQFLKLGYSFEQQSQFSAKFLAQQRNIAKINLDDTKALSEANRNYLNLVDEIARLTGKSRDKAAADLEAMTRELRFGATLAIAEQKGTKDAIATTAELLETAGSKELAEGFKDIFGGATTERSQQLMAATGNRAAIIAEQLENGQITSAEAMRQFQASVRETRNALGSDEFERRVGKLGTVLDPMLVGMRRLDKAQDLNAETLGKAKREQDAAANAKDKETQDVVDAQKAMRDMAVTLDRIVSEKMFDKLAGSVKFLTNTLNDGATLIGKILGLDETPPAAVRAPAPITGDQVNQRRQSAGQAPLSPEAAEAQAGRETMERAYRERNARRNARRGGAAPATEPAGPTSSATQSTEDILASLNVKGSEATAGGAANPKLVELAKKIQEMYPGAKFTALNDLFHQRNYPNSAHTKGLALDFTIDPPPRNSREAFAIKQQLQSLGASKVLDEYFSDKNRYTTGGHFHAEISAMKGFDGLVSGPKSGYRPNLTMHGAEELSVKPANTAKEQKDLMDQQLSLMQEQISDSKVMISLMQSSIDTQQKIYRASVG